MPPSMPLPHPSGAHPRGFPHAAAASAGAPGVAATGAPSVTGASSPKRILVVDDEGQIRAFLKTLLSRRFPPKTRIDECASAEEALAILQNASYDLLITDYKMEQLSGIDLLEKVRTNYPQMARILMTAYHDAEIAIQAVERGAVDGFMNKPFDTKNLMTLVETLLEAPRLTVPPHHPPGPSPARATPPTLGGNPGAPTTRQVPPRAPPAAPASAPPPQPAAAPRPHPRAPAAPTPPPTAAPRPQAPPRATAAPQRPPPAPPAAAEAPGQRAASAREELTRIEHALRHLRVQFGLGRLSAEGYRQANESLRQERARLEVWLLQQSD